MYPVLLFFAAFFYIKSFGFGLFECLLAICSYYVINITVGIGLHRLWAHNTYTVNKVVEYILAFFASATLQGPILKWSSDHAKHHAYTDTDKDPHSPSNFGGGVRGFLWSHIGWMLVKDSVNASFDKGVLKRLGRNKIVVFQFKHYLSLAVFTNSVFPAMLGFLSDMSIKGVLAGFIFCGIGRALQQHATFCVNSALHYFGDKTYDDSTAGDMPFMAIFLLGENWHNFHHAFPSDYRNGVKWYHFDVHKWIIWSLCKIGLARNLSRASDVRIFAKRKAIMSSYLENKLKDWKSLQDAVESWKNVASDKARKKVFESYDFYNSRLASLSFKIKNMMESQELSKKVVQEMSHLLDIFEKEFEILRRNVSTICVTDTLI
ncbi:acyl-CoA desaturase [Candidatus Sneabacter namystus]|uniref:acyl-CoA desaturase n=1 Tax=Candidatus Sneabacter namystus TaxID=2601646 RepID=UPI001C0F0E5C|nr:fatty acid desaturase [Candidatus Sneabacter namystus]